MLRSIIEQLRSQRDRLDEAITALEASIALEAESYIPQPLESRPGWRQRHRTHIEPIVVGHKKRRVGRPGMRSLEERQEISKRMKRYWANRHKEEALK